MVRAKLSDRVNSFVYNGTADEVIRLVFLINALYTGYF